MNSCQNILEILSFLNFESYPCFNNINKYQNVVLSIAAKYFFKKLAKFIKQFFLIIQNVVTANFSYIYQWLLSNIDFAMWTQQVSNRSMNNI